MFKPNLAALAAPQRRLWNELEPTPKDFVLYGGTALALRLGHRRSEDLDFFSNGSFSPALLMRHVPYLKEARIEQFEENTLSCVIDRGGPVKISYFGDLNLMRVHDPDVADKNEIQVASLLDIAVSKVKTIQQRAEAKDYFDIASILDAGIDLPKVLAAAKAIYGRKFVAQVSLKALSYFEDGNLPTLTPATQNRLRTAALEVNLEQLPLVVAKSGLGPRKGMKR